MNTAAQGMEPCSLKPSKANVKTCAGQMQKWLIYGTKMNIISLESNVIMLLLKALYPNKWIIKENNFIELESRTESLGNIFKSDYNTFIMQDIRYYFFISFFSCLFSLHDSSVWVHNILNIHRNRKC